MIRCQAKKLSVFIKSIPLVIDISDDIIGTDEEIDRHITNLYNDSKEIENLMLEKEWPRDKVFLKEYIRVIKKKYEILQSRQTNVDGRVTPFCICIAGPSQIGKSQVMQDISNKILSHVPAQIRTYTRSATEHFDGYNGHQCILIDDWASSPDEAYTDILQWVSCVRTPLPMASVDDAMVGKKGACFEAKLLILSTNTPYPSLSVQSFTPEAIYNRRHILAKAEMVGSYKADYSHLVMRIAHPSTPSVPASEPMSYSDFLDYCAKKYSEHMETQDRLMDIRKTRRLLFEAAGHAKAQGKSDYITDSVTETLLNTSATALAIGTGATFALYGFRPATAVMGSLSLFLAILRGAFVSNVDERRVENIQRLLKEYGYNSIIRSKVEAVLSEASISEKAVSESIIPLDKIETLFSFVAGGAKSFASQSCFQFSKFVFNCNYIPLKVFWNYFAARVGYTQIPDLEIKKHPLSIVLESLHATPSVYQIWSCLDTVKQLCPDFHDPLLLHFRKTFRNFDATFESSSEAYVQRDNKIKPHVVRQAEADLEFSSEAYVLRDSKVKPHLIKAEATNDSNADSLLDVIMPSLCKVTARVDDHVTGTLNGLMIGGTLLLVPYHILVNAPTQFWSKAEISLSFGFELSNSPQKKFSFKIVREDIRKTDMDWCVINLGRTCPQFKRLLPHFVRTSDLSLISQTECVLVTKREYPHHLNTNVSLQTYPVSYDAGKEKVYITKSLVYKAQTRDGDCGGPLVAFDTNLQGKILGIHVCAFVATNKAHSTIITFEQLDTVISSFPAEAQLNMPQFDLISDNVPFVSHQFDYIGKVANPVFSPTTTTLQPSLIASHFPVEKFPAPLHKNDNRIKWPGEPEHLIIKSLRRYDGPSVMMDLDLASGVVSHTIKDYKILDSNYTRRLLNDDEMVNGFDCLNRINVHSSPGYPYTLSTHKELSAPGKMSYISFDGNKWFISSNRLKRDILIRENMAKLGARVPSLWTAQLKDELISPKKILAGDTRLFLNPPVDFTLLARKYFGTFSSWFIKNGMLLGNAVGMNPESVAWTELYDHLRYIGNWAVEKDYTFFDGSLIAQLIFMVLDVINAWYDDGEENARVRLVLFHEIVFTYIIFSSYIVMKFKGNPSGNPLTSIMNCIVSIFLFKLYYLFCVPINFRDLDLQKKYTRCFVMGDDSLDSISDEIREFYTVDKIKAFAESLTMTVTSSTKNDTDMFRELDDCSFLKRKFRKVGKYTLPLLDMKSIHSMLVWTTKSKFMNNLTSTQVNVETALRYLYFYGKSVFDTFRDKLAYISASENIPLTLPSYEYFDRCFFTFGYIDTVLGNDVKPTYLSAKMENSTTNASPEAATVTSGEISNVQTDSLTSPEPIKTVFLTQPIDLNTLKCLFKKDLSLMNRQR